MTTSKRPGPGRIGARPALMLTVAVALAFLFLAAGAAAPAGGSAIIRVSVDGFGVAGNADSRAASISGDGRYVAFESVAANLVAGDNNNARDVFVHDTLTGLTEHISRHSNGTIGNFDSSAPAISTDGRYVAFVSFATNLINNDDNNVADVFLHDRDTDTTLLVSRALDGTPANDISGQPAVSADGRFVAFASFGSDLVVGDTAGQRDVFRFDRVTGGVARVSVDSAGVQGNGESSQPAISGDGQHIAFASFASNLVTGDAQGYQDIFIFSYPAATILRASRGLGGAEALGDSFDPSLSADGQLVAFTSFAANIVANDSNLRSDVFVFNRANSASERISLADDEAQATERSDQPAISGDGNTVVFRSRAGNLVAGDTNGADDIFTRNRAAGTTARVSVRWTGAQTASGNDNPAVATNGRFVAFDSPDGELVPGDGNAIRDVFRVDRDPPPPPTPTPTPAPRLTVNHASGAPGSIFFFFGSDFPPGVTAQVSVNQTPLGPVAVSVDGELGFRICSAAGTESGFYSVTVAGGGQAGFRGFRVDPAAPLRPDAGVGPLYCLPANSALTESEFEPVYLHRK